MNATQFFSRLFSVVFILFLLFPGLSAQPDMILVEGGKFIMGCTEEQKPHCDGDEFPVHAVAISDFMMGIYEVQQSLWTSIMGDNPSMYALCGPDCPVENIDWYSMLVFCNELSLADLQLGPDQRSYYRDEGLTEPWTLAHYSGEGDTPSGPVFLASGRKGYRLPTEAEWEFASRGGSMSKEYTYSGSNSLDEVGWFDENSSQSSHPCGLKQPNELGLYDMSGNVWERVLDWYGDYEGPHSCDPGGPEDGSDRVFRGGSFQYAEKDCINASRYFNKPTRAVSNVGFRVVRNP